MLKIQHYLQNNSLENLTKELGIKVKRHNKYSNLINFCYSQIDSPYSHPIVRESRGLILDEQDNWRVVAYPFKRFYNHGEECADEIDWSTASVLSKLDGSLIIIYYYNKEWLIATKGTPDASGNVGDFGFTFSELAWEVFNKEYSINTLDTNLTYMFELCSIYNRVVVPIEQSSLTLIGVRNNLTLKEESIKNYTDVFKVVESHPLNSWKAIQDSLSNLDGYYNEGYVVVDSKYNRVKIKHPTYVALSHIKEGLTNNRLLEIIKTSEGSEFLSYFPEYTSLYNDLKSKYDFLVNTIEAVYSEYKHIEDKKEFALAIQQYKFTSILFNIRNGNIKSIKEGLIKMNLDKLKDLLENPTT